MSSYGLDHINAHPSHTTNRRALNSIVDVLTSTTTNTLNRLRRINNVLTAGPDKPPDGPRPVPMGMIGNLNETLADLDRIEEECVKIESALGIDQPPQATGH